MEYPNVGNANIKSIKYNPVYVEDSKTEINQEEQQEITGIQDINIGDEVSDETWTRVIEDNWGKNRNEEAHAVSQEKVKSDKVSDDNWGKVIHDDVFEYTWGKVRSYEKAEDDKDDDKGSEDTNSKLIDPNETKKKGGEILSNESKPKTCIYKYKRTAGLHTIGDICGDKVARNPKVVEGADFCSLHQPEVGTFLEKCNNVHYRKGKQVACKNNLSNPEDLFCLSCVAKKQRESDKEKRHGARIKVKQNKPKCKRKLTKGSRKGKVCGKSCMIDEEYCKDCFKSKDAQAEMEKDNNEEVSEESESESEESENDTEEDEDKDKERQEYEDKYPLLKLPVLDISNFHDLPNVPESTKKVLKRLPLPQHIKYILAILPLKKETHPDELAAILKWYSNGQIRCESLTDKYYYQYSDDLKDWMKVPFKNKKYINNLKTNIIHEVIKIYNDMLYNSELSRDAQKRLLENLSTEVSGKVFTYLISLLVADTLKSETVETFDENILKFINLHVQRSSDRKKAVTTTEFMDKYNEWCEKEELPLFTSGAVHFGRLLSRINKNNRWATFSNGMKKHIISFK